MSNTANTPENNIKRIILRHLSGSKANQVEEFPLEHFSAITLGRTASSDVTYDPDQDDLVSREHGRIERDKDDPTRFMIQDLNSRNGIYVNKQKIKGIADVAPGDVVQLGPGGPEFQFDLDPRPDKLMRATRLAEAPEIPPSPPARPTRAGQVPDRPTVAPPPAKTGVGKATVERMVMQSQKQSQRSLLLGGVGLIVVLAALAYFLWPDEQPTIIQTTPEGPSTLTPTEIAGANEDKTVYIEVGWKLVHTPTGEDVYHLYEFQQDVNGNVMNDQFGNPIVIPAYFRTANGNIEPVLVTNNDNGINKLIGGQHAGSGFIVSEEGFILTNRHVAATWHTSYIFPQDAFPGNLYTIDSNGNPSIVGEVRANQVTAWVPAEAQTLGYKPLTGKILEGQNMYLDVTFARNDLRTPAELVRTSNRHDVAMIKVDMPESLPKVTLYDNYDSIQAGDQITVMGYPGVSPDQYVGTASNDPFNRNPQWIKVPSPTVTTGNIGRVLKARAEGVDGYVSQFGDSYQLTINATGSGNSGGPAFDDQGRVVGIFYASQSEVNGPRITFAVPIRYGMELMGRNPVLP